ncbi:MAG: class B sortase [Lachnospiraceae bacterium]|nr:class B sortase [Lachnospiraceae bacterium]
MGRKRFLPVLLFILAVLFLGAGVAAFLWEHADPFGNLFPKVTSESSDRRISSDESSEISVSSTDNTETSDPVTDNTESSVSTANSGSSETVESEPEPEPEPEPVRVENPYKEYFLENPDMAAWLRIPDTIVDYPVMWTPEDEDFYLLRNFKKKKSGNGCLILDTDSCMEPLTTNLIIHGHNNKGAMFGNLSKYEKKEYRDEHPFIYLSGKDYEHAYVVMAAFRSQVFYSTDVCFKFYKFFQADTEEEFKDFYDNVKAMSYYDTGVEASFGDRFLTLSTCSYHTENGRFVVVAKEVEPGDFYEPLDIDVNSKESNDQ